MFILSSYPFGCDLRFYILIRNLSEKFKRCGKMKITGYCGTCCYFFSMMLSLEDAPVVIFKT